MTNIVIIYIYNDIAVEFAKQIKIPAAYLGGILITKLVGMKGHQFVFQAVFSLILQNFGMFLLAQC